MGLMAAIVSPLKLDPSGTKATIPTKKNGGPTLQHAVSLPTLCIPYSSINQACSVACPICWSRAQSKLHVDQPDFLMNMQQIRKKN
jgi:hypothetical protein